MTDPATAYAAARLSWHMHAEAIGGPVPFDVGLCRPCRARSLELERRADLARYVVWLTRHARPSGSAWGNKGVNN